MDIMITAIYILLLGIIIDYVIKPKSGKEVAFRIPILGHLLLFLRNKNIHILLTDLAGKYGNVYVLQLFNKKVFVLNGYEAIYEALVKKGKQLAGRPDTFRLRYTLEQNDLTTQDFNPRWRKIRTFAHSILRQYGDGLNKIEDIALDISGDLVISLKKDSLENGYIDPHDKIYLSIVNTLCSLITGKRYSEKDHAFRTYVELDKISVEIFNVHQGIELDVMPWLRFFGNSTYKKMKRFKILTDEVFHNFKRDSIENAGAKQSVFNMFQDFVNKNSKYANELNEDVIKLILVDIIGAGIGSSSRSLYVLLHVLATDIPIQETIASEITTVMKQSGTDKIHLHDRENMPYTRACLLELQRYISIFSIGVPHKAMEDTEIQGINIPKGSDVITNLWQLHHDSSIWKSPFKFDPTRFLDSTGQLHKSTHANMQKLMTFGRGPRMCLGHKIAQSRLFIFTTSIIKSLIILPHPLYKGPLLHDPRNFTFGAILDPPRGKLKFQAR